MFSEMSMSKSGTKTNSSVVGDAKFTGKAKFVAKVKEMAQDQKHLGEQVQDYLYFILREDFMLLPLHPFN
jgi:hypothetical protein